MNSFFVTIRSEDRESGYPSSAEFEYKFPEKLLTDLKKKQTVEIVNLEINHPRYTVEGAENAFCFNEGISVGNATMEKPYNQIVLTDDDGKDTTLTVPATLMPIHLDPNTRTLDDVDYAVFTTQQPHGLTATDEALFVGAQINSDWDYRAGVLLSMLHRKATVHVDKDPKQIWVSAEDNPIVSLQVGGHPNGYLYTKPYSIATLVGVLSHRATAGYSVEYAKVMGKMHITHDKTFRIPRQKNGVTFAPSTQSLLGVLGLQCAAAANHADNKYKVSGTPAHMSARVSEGNYANPTTFANSVEEAIHNRCLLLPSERVRSHFFILTQLDAAFQQRVVVPNGKYTPEMLCRVINASNNAVAVTMERQNQNQNHVSYTFACNEGFPFMLDFSAEPAHVLARTLGFLPRRYSGKMTYKSFQPVVLSQTTNRLPCPAPSVDVAGERDRYRYPSGMYNITGTVPNKSKYIVMCDSGNSWSIPNQGQSKTLFDNMKGKGVIHIRTKNLPQQQSYNFNTGDVVRVTGSNEEVVEVSLGSGYAPVPEKQTSDTKHNFDPGQSTEGIEKATLHSLGGGGYVYPPKVHYTDGSPAPVVPVVLDGKIVCFDVPYSQPVRVLGRDGLTLTLAGSGLYFSAASETIVVTGSNNKETATATWSTEYARTAGVHMTVKLSDIDEGALNGLGKLLTCEVVETNGTPKVEGYKPFELVVAPPQQPRVTRATTVLTSNPFKIKHTLYLEKPLNVLATNTNNEKLNGATSARAIVWTGCAVGACNRGFVVADAAGKTVTVERDYVPGAEDVAALVEGLGKEGADLGKIHAAVSTPVKVTRVENVKDVDTGRVVFTDYDPSTVRCMKGHIQMYGCVSCKKGNVRKVTAVENKTLTLSSALTVGEYVVLSGSAHHDGVYAVPAGDGAQITLPVASGSIETGAHCTVAATGAATAGTYNFDEQVVLYQDPGALFCYYDADELQRFEQEGETTTAETLYPLFNRAKNYQSTPTTDNDDVGVLGFIVYAPTPRRAYAVTRAYGPNLGEVVPAHPGFLTNANYLATKQVDPVPPIIFSGGELSDDAGMPARAKVQTEKSHVVSSKFHFNGAHAEVNGKRLRITLAYVPKRTFAVNNMRLTTDARVRLILEEEPTDALVKDTIGNYGDVTVRNFWPFDGVYQHQTNYTPISPQSKNSWRFIDRDSDYGPRTVAAEIELRAGVGAHSGGPTAGLPQFAWAPSSSSIKHDDESYQLGKILFGQVEYVFPNDVYLQHRGDYVSCDEVLINGAHITTIDELTTRVGIITSAGYTQEDKFNYTIEYNPNGICDGDGFVDKAFLGSKKMANKTGKEGIQTPSGNISITVSPVFRICPELLVESTNAMMLSQKTGGATVAQFHRIYRRLGFTKDPDPIMPYYEADALWDLETSSYRVIMLSVNSIAEKGRNAHVVVRKKLMDDGGGSTDMVTTHVSAKLTVPGSHHIRGYTPQKLTLDSPTDVQNIHVQVLNDDGTPYNMHGMEFIMTLAFGGGNQK